jgi:hypothetical protein
MFAVDQITKVWPRQRPYRIEDRELEAPAPLAEG